MPYFSYMLECRDGSYYCGWTTDLEKRVEAHASGKARDILDPGSLSHWFILKN